MTEKWFGSIVSVDCGEVLGIFEGEISNVDSKNQTISLINVSRNNMKCQVPEVTLNTYDIKNLKLLQSTVHKKIECSNLDEVSVLSQPSNAKNGFRVSPPALDENQKKKTEGKKKTKKVDAKKWLKERDEACFSAPVDSEVLDTEFDFEKNLALFDKQAVFDEINALSKSDHIKLVDCNKRSTKYRHDENILTSDVPTLKQISVPCTAVKEYVTDSGLIVPSVSIPFKKLLYKKAEAAGITINVRTEMIGRAASEMVLQLLGGNHRINPQNTHQRPTVVVLSGSHIQGAQAMNCARHLANHCVNVTVFSPLQSEDTDHLIMRELSLLALCGSKTASDTDELPSSVDIIINALDKHEIIENISRTWLNRTRLWMKQSKAPILSLDPSPDVTPPEPKWILAPALPFPFNTEKSSLYICDIGFPKGIFSLVDSSYSSPFGSKFIIPLYSKSS